MTVSPQRYSTPAIMLHWAIAALIVVNFWVGLRYADAHGLARFELLQWHKSFGFTILALSLARLAWRLAHRPPPYPEGMKAWEMRTAALVHGGFYVLMIGLPLTGWLIVSASPTNIPTLLYKTIPVPHLGFVHELSMPMRLAAEKWVGQGHAILAWTTAALLVLHIGAALKHQFLDRDGTLCRVMPFGGRSMPAVKEG